MLLADLGGDCEELSCDPGSSEVEVGVTNGDTVRTVRQ